MNNHAKRVIVGLSGGVDSSVAALLLLQQGFQVEALFMKNWEAEDNDAHCLTEKDFLDAQKVCHQLKIPLHTVNFSEEYWDKVFEHFLSEHRLGRTPNPDILCNQEIKFKAFLNYALQLGADYIATGHYAKKMPDSSSDHNPTQPVDSQYQLHKANDLNKDQTYFLYALTQAALSKTLFPLGNLDKPSVRKIANDAGFANAYKKDSTGICFIGERKFSHFLKQYILTKPGAIETAEGTIVGQHDGLTFYTLGQRHGLNIGGQSNCDHAPWYVAQKDLARNVLVVVQGNNHPLLFGNRLEAKQIKWISKPQQHSFACTAKIRYRQTDEPCTVEVIAPEHCVVSFAKPQRAITPGQSVVFYDNTLCLGGGVIQ